MSSKAATKRGPFAPWARRANQRAMRLVLDWCTRMVHRGRLYGLFVWLVVVVIVVMVIDFLYFSLSNKLLILRFVNEH